jgi:tetrapyrrole methylase family protein/MazG family protein
LFRALLMQSFDHLVELMAKLRAPDGCPWDRKQTHESLKPYLIEEAYEVLESIDADNPGQLRDELGDVLLQIIFHAQIAVEQDHFTIDDVIHSLSEKLVRRHPHVFGREDQREVLTPEEVKHRWEKIKHQERTDKGDTGSSLDGVPKTLPALLRAYQIQARASRVGFDWTRPEPILAKLDEELDELRQAMASSGDDSDVDERTAPGSQPQERVEAELGDVLFTLVNLARFLKVNPEEALRKAVQRFTDRFHFMETRAMASGRALQELTAAEMDALWDQAKRTDSAQRSSFG